MDITLKFISLGRNFIFLEQELDLSWTKLSSLEDNEKRIQER